MRSKKKLLKGCGATILNDPARLSGHFVQSEVGFCGLALLLGGVENGGNCCGANSK